MVRSYSQARLAGETLRGRRTGRRDRGEARNRPRQTPRTSRTTLVATEAHTRSRAGRTARLEMSFYSCQRIDRQYARTSRPVWSTARAASCCNRSRGTRSTPATGTGRSVLYI